MNKYRETVHFPDGRIAVGASITVRLAGTETAATIYSDDGVTPASNPLTADANGEFSFYAADLASGYDLYISGTATPPGSDTALTITARTVSDIRPLDLFDTNVEDGAAATADIIAFTDNNTAPGVIAGYAQLYMNASGNPEIKDEDGNIFSLGSGGVPWHQAVDDHSADNTGATDATTEMQACLDAAGSSGSNVAYFEAGTYKYSQLTIPEGVEIVTDGADRTFFDTTQAATVGGGDTFYTTATILAEDVGHATNLTSNCKIRGITFSRTSGIDASNVVYIQLCNFDRSTFEDLVFTKGGGAGVTYALYAGNGSAARESYNQNLVTNCYMDGNSTDVLYYDEGEATNISYGNRVSGNIAKNMSGANPVIRVSRGAESTLVDNNVIDTYGGDGIFTDGNGTTILSNHFLNGTTGVGDIAIQVTSSVASNYGMHTKIAFNFYNGVNNTHWYNVSSADYYTIIGDGGSDAAPDTEGNGGGACMSRTVLQRLNIDGSTNANGIRGTNPAYTSGSSPADSNQYFPWNATASANSVVMVDNAGAPSGSVTPAFVGQMCRDTNATPDDVYIAVGTGNTDWVKITYNP